MQSQKRAYEDVDESEIKRSKSYEKVFQEVMRQGPIGQLVILDSGKHIPYVKLSSSIASTNINLSVEKKELNIPCFVLSIAGEEYSSGNYATIQESRGPLSEIALEKLKHTCFFIYDKNNYVNVSPGDLDIAVAIKIDNVLETDSNARQIMLKMGWTGKGLGVNEQGRLDQPVLQSNLTREGLGTRNITKQVTDKLQQYANSPDVYTLMFDSQFTKEERMSIHKIAAKIGLKTKSIGKDLDRRLTVCKKIDRLLLVKRLLQIGGENEFYKLQIPTNFQKFL